MKALGMYIFGGSQTIGHMNVGWKVNEVLEMTENMKENNAYHFCRNYPNIKITLPSEWNNIEYKTKLKKEKYDLLYANNPCSGLSDINRNASADNDTNHYFYDVFDMIESISPKAFFIENAPTLVKKGLPILKNLVKRANDKYYITIINDIAGNHNVPMHRKRTFTIGFNREYFPGSPCIKQDMIKTTSILEALSGLNDNSYNMERVKEHDGALEKLYKYADNESIQSALYKHPEVYDEIPTEKLKNEFNSYKNRMDSKGHVWDKSAFKPDGNGFVGSMTSMSHFIHPTENRDFYVREYARVMGYPDNFKFYQYECNTPIIQCMAQGVPVHFIEYISTQIKKAFENKCDYSNNDVTYINQVNPYNINTVCFTTKEFLNTEKIDENNKCFEQMSLF